MTHGMNETVSTIQKTFGHKEDILSILIVLIP